MFGASLGKNNQKMMELSFKDKSLKKRSYCSECSESEIHVSLGFLPKQQNQKSSLEKLRHAAATGALVSV